MITQTRKIDRNGVIDQVLRVRLVEDDALFARAVKKILEQSGYICEWATTISEARSIIDRFLPDILLLDIRLPDGSSMDLLTELSNMSVAVIFMTSYTDADDVTIAAKYGVTDFLQKPIDLDILLNVVKEVRSLTVLKH